MPKTVLIWREKFQKWGYRVGCVSTKVAQWICHISVYGLPYGEMQCALWYFNFLLFMCWMVILVCSEEDVKSILTMAATYNLDVIPLVQTFGHFEVNNNYWYSVRVLQKHFAKKVIVHQATTSHFSCWHSGDNQSVGHQCQWLKGSYNLEMRQFLEVASMVVT